MIFTLPKLTYKYSELEPYIDSETMKIHHSKHHQAYVDNLNKAISGFGEFEGKSIEEILKNIDTVPKNIKQQVINHGGGHANHSLFWKLLSPAKSAPNGKLAEAVNSTFGSIEKFKDAFTQKSMSLFGSGWTFLILTKNGKLALKRHSFQNSPLMYGNTPLVIIDLWEHAYYLKYQNRRAEYVEAWWNVVNWNEASKIFLESQVKPKD